jgi:coenzyme F420-0:L-glutamate ligase/coenzyme F420-1:gamma-L-glutamate ligase
MEIFGIEGIGEIRVGDDLAAIIHEAASSAADTMLADGDVLVVRRKSSQKLKTGLWPSTPAIHSATNRSLNANPFESFAAAET